MEKRATETTRTPGGRVLIVGCSQTKDPAGGLLPALDRYRGAYYQMIKQFPREELPEIVILSAEFGFISAREPVPDYDRRMDRDRAAELLADPRQRARFLSLVGAPAEILVAAGEVYRRVVLDLARELPSRPLVSWTSGGIGYQRRALKLWLQGRPLDQDPARSMTTKKM